MTAAGLTAEDGRRQAWLIVADGPLYGGAAAINGALGYAWWGRWLLPLYHLPGMRQFQDAVYRWVARNRGRFAGETPGCEAEFDCEE